MAQPMDAILAFHNAFRRDIAAIDEAALEMARGDQEQRPILDRFRFFNEVLVWHAIGEEVAIFPALEEVAPLLSEPYVKDHRGLDAAYESLSQAAAAEDTLQTARASAVFRFHLDLHLAKEDAQVYRLIRERIPIPDQERALGVMAGVLPPERFPEVIAWIFPLLRANDRENLARVWKSVMPPDVFSRITPMMQKAIGEDWSDLIRRFPELTG